MMLEIASEITLCLLIAALIGFILGFIVAKATNKISVQESTKINNKAKISNSTEKMVDKAIKTINKETKKVETPTIKSELKVSESFKENDTKKEIISEVPELLNAPRDNQKDTLTQIKGIGPKVEKQLNATGIYHFEQIANWSEGNIQWLEEHTTFAHRAKKDLWVNQAKSLI